MPQRQKARPGRNDPCFCGSGRKYKKCCGLRSEAPPSPEPARLAAESTLPAAQSGRPAAESARPPRENPTRPSGFGSLEALVSAQRYGELEETVTRLLADEPGSGFLWKVLALALWRQSKDPLEALQRAANLLPDDAEAHSNLGNALRARGRLDDAVRCQRRALALRPDYAEAHNNLGSALQDLGRTEEAVTSYCRATELNSDFAIAHANLGNALKSLGRPAEAIARYRLALAAAPSDAAFLSRLGSALIDLGECDEAALSYRRALHVTPDSAELHCNLGMALALAGRTDEAERSGRRALEIDPSFSAALVLLAELHAARGNFSAAQELLQRAVSLDPDSPEGWACLAQYRGAVGGNQAWLAQAQRLLARPLPARREAHLRYALGNYFDETQDFAQAFSHYRRANELTKQYAPRYEREQLSRYVDLVTQLYDEEWLAAARLAPAGSERAVFIVGMWRSGTTLAEQILASHPLVFGAGEFAYWNTAAERYLQALATEAWDESTECADLTGGEGRDGGLRRLAVGYLERLHVLSADATRVIDKMSSNFLHLGLIHACLPGARFIHLERDPIDTCLSIYFQSFLHSHRYANDLEDLAHYYGEYRRLMQHWRRVLPAETMLEVPYEQLVEHQELWSRRMVEFIGLPWDASCLDFERTERTVTTASKWQVRQKMSRASIGRWRNYREFIAPLLQLAPPAPPD